MRFNEFLKTLKNILGFNFLMIWNKDFFFIDIIYILNTVDILCEINAC